MSHRYSLLVLSAFAAAASSVFAANPADWKNFTSNTAQAWSTAGDWTAGTGVPTLGNTLVINFDPSKAGTTTTSGGISQTFTSTNDLGTVLVNTLNFSGSSSSATARAITISGGTLQFEGSNAAITNASATNGATGLVNYTITSNIALGTDLAVNLNGTGTTFLSNSAVSTISASSSGLKMITVSGAGIGSIAGNATAVISDGSGQVGLTMAGSGVLFLGGTNSFTGGLFVKSGTLALNNSSAGMPASLGAGEVKIGDNVGSADATLDLTRGNLTFQNNFTVLGGGGVKTIQISAGNSTAVLSSTLTVNGDVTLKYSGAAGGNITVGSSSGTAALVGAGTVTVENAGSGNMVFTGSNSGFTGNLVLKSGTTRINSANAFNAANTVSVAAAGVMALNGQDQTIAGLNNVSGTGGAVTNIGAARTLTLAGSGSYNFAGVITAATTANLAVTKTGSGTQSLSGANSYDGVTTVSAGTLLINGDSSAANGAVTVASGATLGGSGIIGGATTIQSGGILSPGNSPGTLTFNSDLNISASGTARFEGGDLVDVNGTLNLANDWVLTLTTGFQDGGTMTLFTYTTAGTFDLTPIFNLTGLGFTPTGPVFLTDTGSAIVLNGLSAVPEPATWAMIVGGTLVLTLRRRRQT